MVISNHAKMRIRKRVGIPAKSVDRYVENFLKKGTMQTFSDMINVTFGNFIMIIRGNVVVTLLSC